MAAPVEDGVYVAVCDYVHVLFGLFVSGGVDVVGVYAADKGRWVESEFKCKSRLLFNHLPAMSKHAG